MYHVLIKYVENRLQKMQKQTFWLVWILFKKVDLFHHCLWLQGKGKKWKRKKCSVAMGAGGSKGLKLTPL